MDASFSLFGIPRAWEGVHEIRQTNALESWAGLSPRPNIFLFGNEVGTAERAREYGAYHMPDIMTSQNGVPDMGDIFKQMQAILPESCLCYMNCDDILPRTFSEVATRVAHAYGDAPFLAIGQKIDIEINEYLQLDDSGWERLQRDVESRGELHQVCAIDYFLFKSGMYSDMPDLYIGYPAWDNWMVIKALDMDARVIDITKAVTIIHQHKDVNDKSRDSYEWKSNKDHFFELREKVKRNGFISDATLRLKELGENNGS